MAATGHNGIGGRTQANRSYLTEIRTYRASISTADASCTGPTGAAGVADAMNCSATQYAADMNLNILVKQSKVPGALDTAKLNLWYSEDSDGPWYYVDQLDVAYHSQMFRYADCPPGYYKITLLDKSATTLDIYYQYRM